MSVPNTAICSADSASHRIMALHRSGSRLPIVWVHPSFNLHPFIREMGPDQPFYGLPPVTFPHGRERLTFEEIATTYVQMLRSVRPSGPYYLAGWCLSGMLAYEIAQQLRAQGEQVPLLILFDPNPAVFQVIYKKSLLDFFIQRTAFHLHQIKLYEGANKLNYLWERAQSLGLYLSSWFRRRAFDAFVSLGSPVPNVLRNSVDIMSEALIAYKPERYQGCLIIFQPNLRCSNLYPDAQRRWEDLAPNGVEIVTLHGNHTQLFVPSNLKTAAKVLARRLA